MFGVKNIKLQMYGGLIGAVIAFMSSSSMFSNAKNALRAVITIDQEMSGI